ncbi:alpha-ketoglutarate-dependent dioxygenase AlkB family protein [Undibacterium terreum]|uniref:Alkylated DNA repair protein n=1 Tax=Undibacterium terreum TaxID=1224302 RepID=A0A916XGU6_9BURK|nr:alpha-ketoglutarate-dependent dioxygenase AlkB [Undibacterium terreum]GGC70822.1 alkylated DNA repair protein [Undibacterium terreum]
MNETLDLFAASGSLESIPLPDAEIGFARGFYTGEQAAQYMEQLLNETAWRKEKIQVWGKEHWQPRLTAWYGDAGSNYSYSGLTLERHPWTPALLEIKHDVEAISGHHFNSVLLNLYRDENDSVGWHADNEAELGRNPVIASVSLGQTRTFKLRHRNKPELKTTSIQLNSGSLLLMAGSTQRFWQHAVDKERQPMEPRINLTFRHIAGW